MYEDLKNEFISEVKDLLAKTEQKLLLLEQDAQNKKLVEDIFRSMHTIKGSAGIYGYTKTVEVAHTFENLFSLIRDDKLSVDNKIISLALKAVDVLSSLITAKSEEDIPASVIQELMDEIDIINSQIKESKNIEKKSDKPLDTYYILFEPNADITERGIKIDTLLSDFDSFEHKIITKYTDKERKAQGKLEDFYEIIVASQYSADDLKAIFLFTPNEVQITQIADFNLFDDEKFLDFYQKAVKTLTTDSQRLELLKNYADKAKERIAQQSHAENKNEPEAPQKASKTIIGHDEIKQVIDEAKQKYLQYIKVPAKRLDLLLSLVSELIISNSQLAENTVKRDYEQILQLSESISKIINEIKETTLHLRLIEIKTILPPYYRLIRDLTLKLGKKVDFIVEGTDTHIIDKTIVDKISMPVMHILRNAIDHGIETPEERRKKGKRETGIIRFISYYSNVNVII